MMSFRSVCCLVARMEGSDLIGISLSRQLLNKHWYIERYSSVHNISFLSLGQAWVVTETECGPRDVSPTATSGVVCIAVEMHFYRTLYIFFFFACVWVLHCLLWFEAQYSGRIFRHKFLENMVCCFHLQGLKMEAVRSSEKTGNCQTTRRHMPEDGDINIAMRTPSFRF